MIEINYTSYKKPTDYVKFDQGENKIVIVSKGYFRKIHGMKTSRSWIPLGECQGIGCKHCADGNDPKTKYTWMVYVTNEIKVMDAGTMIGDQICNLAKEKGVDPNGYEFTISKSGVGLKTQYQVTWGPRMTFSSEVAQFIDLGKKYLVKKYFSKP